MKFIRNLLSGFLLVSLMFTFSAAYALEVQPAVPSTPTSASAVQKKLATSYVGGKKVTLYGKLKITKNGSSYTAILTLNSPLDFMGIQGVKGKKDYLNRKDIQVFVPNKLNGKEVRVTGTLSGSKGTGEYKRDYVLLKATATATPAAKSVSLNKKTASIAVGKTLQLSATVKPADANPFALWSSSKTSVASVDSKGIVTAKKKGTATITAKASNGKKATCTVTVTVPVSGVKLSDTSVSIVEGKTKQLTATVSPSNATNKAVTWKSSNTKIATISDKGLVTAKKVGKATITVTTKDGKKKATCVVTVTEAPKVPLREISVTSTNYILTVGKTHQLDINYYPFNATNKTVTWKSLNPSVATVDSKGVVTAKKAGDAIIVVSSKEKAPVPDGWDPEHFDSSIIDDTLIVVTKSPVQVPNMDSNDLQLTFGKKELKFPASYEEIVKAFPDGWTEIENWGGVDRTYYRLGDQNSYGNISEFTFVTEKNNAFLSAWLYTNDPLLTKTKRGIKHGDTLPKVLSLYGNPKYIEGNYGRITNSGAIWVDYPVRIGTDEFLFSFVFDVEGTHKLKVISIINTALSQWVYENSSFQ